MSIYNVWLYFFQLRNHILYLIENYQTVVIVGETGCGKSTQIPQVSIYLFLQHFLSLFLAVLGLHYRAQAFSSCIKWGSSLAVVHGFSLRWLLFLWSTGVTAQ